MPVPDCCEHGAWPSAGKESVRNSLYPSGVSCTGSSQQNCTAQHSAARITRAAFEAKWRLLFLDALHNDLRFGQAPCVLPSAGLSLARLRNTAISSGAHQGPYPYLAIPPGYGSETEQFRTRSMSLKTSLALTMIKFRSRESSATTMPKRSPLFSLITQEPLIPGTVNDVSMRNWFDRLARRTLFLRHGEPEATHHAFGAW